MESHFPMRNPRIAGLICALPLVLIVACSDDEPARDESGGITEEGDLGVTSISVGDCFNDDESIVTGELSEVTDVGAVPCDQPHDNEAYHVFDLPDGDYPGDDALAEQAFTACETPFGEFVGLSYADSELDLFPITPTEASWQQGDREVICAVFLPEQQLTGTVKGSGR